MQVLKIINPESISDEVSSKLKLRRAARGVIFDDNKNIAVLPVSNHDYYKLPGGGIEDGEDIVVAFRRECLEEIGFDAEVISELGMIVEYRGQSSISQTSYCFIGKAVGKKQETTFTEHEMNQGFKQAVWVPFEEAFKLISTSNPNNYAGTFIKERDTLILETARKFLDEATSRK